MKDIFVVPDYKDLLERCTDSDFEGYELISLLLNVYKYIFI